MANEGVLEVPAHLDMATRRFLTSLRNVVMKQQGGVVPPSAPTNGKVTAIAGGNYIQFTRPVDADNVSIFFGPTADISKASMAYLGYSTEYTDNVGKGGVKRYYWLRAYKGGMASVLAGPLSSTSLALGTAATLPNNPPEMNISVKDDSTGYEAPSATLKGGLVNLY